MAKRKAKAVKVEEVQRAIIAEKADWCRKYLYMHGYIGETANKSIKQKLLKTEKVKARSTCR